MTMGLGRGKRALDDKKCFYLYRDVGSVYKVAKALAREGLVNQDTGHPYTPQAVYWAVWRWGVANQKESKEAIMEAARSKGVILTEAEVQAILDSRAKYILYKKKNGYGNYLKNR